MKDVKTWTISIHISGLTASKNFKLEALISIEYESNQLLLRHFKVH